MDKFGDANLWKSEEMPGRMNWEKIFESAFSVLYVIIWGLCLLWFWKNGQNDVEGYSLTVFYIVLPVATFLLSFYFGFSVNFGFYRWLMILFFAVMFLMLRYFTFDLKVMLAEGSMVVPDWHDLIPGAIISGCGMVLGTTLRVFLYFKNKKASEKENE